MRFRRVAPDVLDGGGAGGRATVSGGVRRSRTSGAVTPSEVAYAFAHAWMTGDPAGMVRWSSPDVVCRWVGFGDGPLEATGLDAMLAAGREFERRHGVAASYSVVDALTGASHAAILFELPVAPVGSDRSVRVAIYRVEAARVMSIAVYADHIG